MSFDQFRGSPRPTLGVELELQLVDARSMALRDAADEVLAEIPAEIRGSVKQEFHACCVEVNTGVCRDVDEAERDLAAKLRAVEEAARRRGLRLAWGGTHPFSHWLGRPITPHDRYRELAEYFRETLCRQLTFGLHVHVGVEDGDAAVRVCDRMAEHLPALLAASANSPFWCGRATGLHSHRTEVLGTSPTAGPPPRFRDWDDYITMIHRMRNCGFIETPKDLWWDVRPSPGHGTVEVRACDMPPDLPSALGLAALIQCLVHDLSRREGDGPFRDGCDRMMAWQNRWRAARFGLDAPLVDLRDGRARPAREAVEGLARSLAEVAEALGCARHLDLLRATCRGPGGAGRQLAVYAGTGDPVDVARYQVGDPPLERRLAPSGRCRPPSGAAQPLANGHRHGNGLGPGPGGDPLSWVGGQGRRP